MKIVFDSRLAQKDCTFVAIKGTVVDSHKFIDAAIDKGATTIVCQYMPSVQRDGVEYRVVEDSRAELSILAANYYGNPSHKLRLVGVTGTNGKTTTATLLHSLFTALGYHCGLLSTVVNKIGNIDIPATHTTPDPLELNELLKGMVDDGCEFCFMEVSSHAMSQQRTCGLKFAGGIFTNLTHDHLDYHGTFAEYLRAKKSFFDKLPSSAFALVNVDDKNGSVMLQNCAARHCSYSLRALATYNCTIIEEHIDGMELRIDNRQAWVQFIGRFNAYNLTAVYGAAIELGADAMTVLQTITTLTPVAGRFDIVRSDDGVLAIVDYAHTPDALQNVLDTISQLGAANRVITVVGCGGDRDKTKRAVMARIAAENSTRVILTSDNPRTENPTDILNEMTAGLNETQNATTLVIENRAQAIKTAVALATPGDVILIAGKGHETYQEVHGVREHFDDKEQVKQCFSKR